MDKTRFIPLLEGCGTRFPFLVRPRRFGKSMFANMLFAYYDRAAAFDQNFAGTWIGSHRTPLAGSFHVLKLDFSGIEGGSRLVESFTGKVKYGLRDFVRRYLKGDSRVEGMLDAPHASPAALLTDFLAAAALRLDGKIYLIIDEYDRFAQNVLSSDPEQFRSMTGKDGFLKAFYAVIKDCTQGVIEQTFITGVTSLSLDSMTSGFNIAKNMTASPRLAAMPGFTEEELRELVPQVVAPGHCRDFLDAMIVRMKALHDGCRFSPFSDVTVFNPSMSLYYLRPCQNRIGAGSAARSVPFRRPLEDRRHPVAR